jgi:hypothetical protein
MSPVDWETPLNVCVRFVRNLLDARPLGTTIGWPSSESQDATNDMIIHGSPKKLSNNDTKSKLLVIGQNGNWLSFSAYNLLKFPAQGENLNSLPG